MQSYLSGDYEWGVVSKQPSNQGRDINIYQINHGIFDNPAKMLLSY